MSTAIDPRAIVSTKAQIGENVSIGPNTILEDDVVVGSETVIGANVLVASGARIGRDCRIHHGAVLATVPQDLKFRGEVSTLEIGDHNVIREYATLNRGTGTGGRTVVGNHCFLMAYSHVAHDCVIGNHVIMANSVNMGGHCVIEDHAVLGGMTGIHQFSHIGRHAMIGSGSRVTKDVPPYILAGSEPLAFIGMNIVGLKRRNFPKQVIDHLEKAYQMIYKSGMNVTQAIEKITLELPSTEEIRSVIEFIGKSKRGIIPARR
jgi:UDP-N-acetylglucosamine acyltransferase